MPVNVEKTFYQIFTLAHRIPNIHLRYDDHQIKMTQGPKYLGMTLDQKISWQKHTEITVRKARERLNIFKRLTGKRCGVVRSLQY